MPLPAILQGESRTRLFQGVALGAVATIVIGFGWGGWVLGGTAAQRASDATESAVVSVLAPICVDQFQRADNAVANLDSLMKESSYKREGFIEEGGWAVFPGSDEPSDGVAKACAVMLNDLTSS